MTYCGEYVCVCVCVCVRLCAYVWERSGWDGGFVSKKDAKDVCGE